MTILPIGKTDLSVLCFTIASEEILSQCYLLDLLKCQVFLCSFTTRCHCFVFVNSNRLLRYLIVKEQKEQKICIESQLVSRGFSYSERILGFLVGTSCFSMLSAKKICQLSRKEIAIWQINVLLSHTGLRRYSALSRTNRTGRWW